jgi:glycosyltransferase involved in cell wall biosynthesis
MPAARTLFITPVYPDALGRGPAQRAFQWLKTLERDGEVDVAVVHRRAPDAGTGSGWRPGGAAVFDLVPTATRAAYLTSAASATGSWLIRRRPFRFLTWGREWGFVTAATRRELARHFAERPWQRVFGFRLQVWDYVQTCAELGRVARSDLRLDFDDWESATRTSIAGGLRRAGQRLQALRLAADACHAGVIERWVVARVGDVAVAAPCDAAALRARYPDATFSVFPNRLTSLPPRCGAGSARHLLFLGTLGYFPNQEAAHFALRVLLPQLRRSHADWRLTLAGYDAPEWLRRAAAQSGVRLLECVSDVAALYADAGLVIAPLRSGGGTKIKVLEALGFGRPVIATEHAARGLLLRPTVDFWPAETVAQWVDGCERLASDPQLAEALGRSGREAIREHYVAS